MSTEVSPRPAENRPDIAAYLQTNWIPIIAWLAFAYYWVPTFQYFLKAWDNPDGYYSHGYLIPFMSGFTAWLLRNKAAQMQVRPSSITIIGLVIVLALATVAGIQNSQTVRGLMFPLSLALFVAVLYGWNYVRLFVFPIFYLYFLCPIPEFILLPLSFKIQYYSTIIATYMAKAMGTDAIRIGQYAIETSYVNIEVGNECSGFRMLVALTAFAVFLVYAVKGELWRKLLFVFISMPLAVLVNSLRIALLVAVGHYWDASMVPVLHDYSGYAVLVVAFILMYWIARLLGCRDFRLTQ